MSSPLTCFIQKALNVWFFKHPIKALQKNSSLESLPCFDDALDLEGNICPFPYRLRTQARQIYVLAKADFLGFKTPLAYATPIEARSLFKSLMPFLTKDGGYCYSLQRDGRIQNKRQYAYDQAFVLLACSSLFERFQDEFYLEKAREVWQFLLQIQHPKGGFFNTEECLQDEPRAQNHHMHLLEATLALFEATKDVFWKEASSMLISLFSNHFFDRNEGCLREFLDPNFQNQTEKFSHLEPGHHHEWVWLLTRVKNLLKVDFEKEKQLLFNYAKKGRLASSTLFLDKIDNEPSSKKTLRLWVQTEALRSYALASIWGEPKEQITKQTQALFQNYFLEEKGLWHEHLQFTKGGLISMVNYSPATSLYHIFGALVDTESILNTQSL